MLYPETKVGQYGQKGNKIINKVENEIISFSTLKNNENSEDTND